MHIVYKLIPHEYERYRTHLLKLDTESRILRFGFQATDAVIDSLCDNIESNKSQHKIFVIEDAELNVVAAGHIATVGGNMELAFSVLTEYRNQGMGDALLKRCLRWCQNRNIRQGYMVCLSSNMAMRKLAARNGLKIVQDGRDTEALVTLPDADVYTHMDEIISNNWSMLDHTGKLNRKIVRFALKSLTF